MPAVKECLVSVEYMGLIGNVLQPNRQQYSVPAGSTVRTLLQTIKEKHGADVAGLFLKSDGSLRPTTEIYVNGCDIKKLREVDTLIGEESQVSVVVSLNAIPGG